MLGELEMIMEQSDAEWLASLPMDNRFNPQKRANWPRLRGA
jgi:hypothetical protein